jgi:hypothetical protein
MAGRDRSGSVATERGANHGATSCFDKLSMRAFDGWFNELPHPEPVEG